MLPPTGINWCDFLIGFFVLYRILIKFYTCVFILVNDVATPPTAMRVDRSETWEAPHSGWHTSQI